MFQGSQKLLVGKRWVTDGGANACARCAALDGQEFYYNPKPGQKSMAEMPEPPLHPNCRCKTLEIMDYAQFVEENAEPAAAKDKDKEERRKNPYLYKGEKFYFMGGHWGNDGRTIFNGPAYGYYCGENWSRGRNPKNIKPGEAPPIEVTPVDDMDCKCRKHDNGYDRSKTSTNPKKARLEHDKELIRSLEALPENPNDWDDPPSNVKDAKNFRSSVLWYFKTKLWYNDMEEIYGEEYMIINYRYLYNLFHED